MSVGLVSPVLANDASTEKGAALPKNEIYFDEPVSQGSTPGSAGNWAGSYPDANKWQQLSLPIGNSMMGANVFGEVGKERLTFNQKTVWNGGPSEKRPNYNGGNKTSINGKPTAEYYQDVVDAFLNNASNKDSLANGLVGIEEGYGAYQLLGDIYLDYDRNDDSAWEDYWNQFWASGTTKIDDRDSSISYTGWSNWDKSGWFNNTEKYTNTVGAELSMTFTGSAIRMIGARNGECGKLDVYLDGEKVLEDHVMTSSGAADGQELFALTDLENTEHTLRVVNKAGGSHNKATYDYFEVKTGTTTEKATVLDLKPSNSAQTGIKYTGGWDNWDRSAEPDGASWTNRDEMFIGDSSNAQLELTFNGTGIALFGAINGNSAANMGSFTWSVDGSEEETVNCVGSGPDIERIELFSKKGLEDGEHTVIVKGVNKKLSFDNFVVYSNSEEELVKPEPPKEHTAATNYKRALDIDESIATVEYDRDNTHYTREYLASHPDNVIAMKLTANGEESLDFDFSLPMALEGDTNYGKTSEVTGKITDLTTGDLYIASKLNDNGMKLGTRAKVVVDKGTVAYNDNGILEIRNAEEATIFVSAATDYKNVYPEYRTGETDEEVMARANADVENAAKKGYAQVKEDHIADYKNIYDRVKIDLGQTKPDMTTDVLLKGYNDKTIEESERRYLETELYQFGRYLQISSTRENAEGRPDQDLPANLQGVWSIYAGSTGVVPWGSDYHMNVNMQMNYWPTYMTNMAECALPMIDYIDGLREPGRVTASTYFGIDNSDGKQNGYTAHTQNTPFGWTCPGWAFSWGWSPAAVPWMLQNVYEYYEFTGDTDFLKDKIFPMLEEEAKLYETILKEVTYPNGVTRLSTVPAYSPEHGPYTAGNAYENSLVWQLFNDCIEAANALNEAEPGTVSEETIAKWTDIKDQLKPIEIGDSGQIKEWYHETTLGSEGERGHRHMSHLLGLFPGDLISSDRPEYLEAAKISLNHRGNNATGWGLAQRINSWARVKDGDRAMVLIESLFKNGMYSNLWDAHAPFQIDGNFGYTSGVTEMLMQSNASTIELLPALPANWADGSVDGIVARGNFEVDLDWAEGKLTGASILAKNGGTCKLTNDAFKDGAYTVRDSKGNVVSTSAIEGKDNAISFETTAGETYTVAIGEEPGEEANTTLLGTVVDFAKGLMQDQFKEVGLQAFRNALDEAQKQLDNPKGQNAVDNATNSLSRSLLELRLEPNEDLLKNRNK